MQASPLSSLPAGTDVYIDANIFIYGALNQSTECRDFLRRLEKDVYGHSDSKVLHDVMHKLMLAEAREAYPTVKNAKNLKENPQLVKGLTKWKNHVAILLQLPIHWIDIDWHKVARVPSAASKHGLLCGDSLIASLMEEYGISHIASHDRDFALAGYSVFAPADLDQS